MHWGGTVGGAFQRSGLYRPQKSDDRKREFRLELRKQLERMEHPYNKAPMTTNGHIKQIKRLQSWSENHKDVLKGGRLNFGISQKILNLHLKGLWCFNLLKYPPPHFPVDRIIQQRLRISPIVPWTKIKDEKAYLKIIGAAEDIAKDLYISMPELELRVYNNTLIVVR